MRNWEDLPPDIAGAVGSLLAPHVSPFFLEEEEVPRSGVTVARGWQFARAQDGSTHLWLENRKRCGRGERSSGLRWDMLDWEL